MTGPVIDSETGLPKKVHISLKHQQRVPDTAHRRPRYCLVRQASAIKSLTDVRAAWGTDKFLEGLQTADGLTEQIILKVSTKTKIPQFLRLFQDLRRKKMAS